MCNLPFSPSWIVDPAGAKKFTFYKVPIPGHPEGSVGTGGIIQAVHVTASFWTLLTLFHLSPTLSYNMACQC